MTPCIPYDTYIHTCHDTVQHTHTHICMQHMFTCAYHAYIHTMIQCNIYVYMLTLHACVHIPHAYLHIYEHLQSHAHAHSHTEYVYMYATYIKATCGTKSHAHKITYICIATRTYLHACMHAYIHTWIDRQTCEDARACA